MEMNVELLMYLAHSQFAERLRTAERRRVAHSVASAPPVPDELAMRRPRIVRRGGPR